MNERARKSILVVDDSALMRRLVIEIIEADPDLRVIDVAENGAIALQKVKKYRPDCVLLDIEMPELNGLDVMRRLRLRTTTPVVVLSHLGREGSRERAEAFRLGARDVIDKPTGALNSDLRFSRGRIIRQTLRRVLGLPPSGTPEASLPRTGASTTASVLAMDVPGFATICERLEAAEIVELLNERLTLVETAVLKHKGFVDAQVGRATLAVFGAPRPGNDHAAQAVAAAQDMFGAVQAERAKQNDKDAPRLALGVTILTGTVLAGDLGPSNARRYRTIGGALDLASRLGGANERYGAAFIVCRSTLTASQARTPTRCLDVIQLESHDEPIAIHELLLPQSGLSGNALELYARGWEHYEAGRFHKAVRAFDKVLEEVGSDRPTTLLRSRCMTLLQAPPVDWRGLWPCREAGDFT